MAKVAVTRTGYSEDTPKYYLIHSASLWADVAYNQATGVFEGVRIGATVGGVKVTIEPKIRQVEVDGVLVPAVGQDVLDGISAIAEGTVKEVTAKVLATAILGTARAADADEAPSGYTVIEPDSAITDASYCENIAIVGQLAGSTKPIIAILYNAINTGGLKLETKDKGEAGVALKLEARSPASSVEDPSGAVKLFFPPQDISAGSLGEHPLEDQATVDKTALAAKIAVVQALNAETYTSATWGPLYYSLQVAIAVNANASASQAQVDAALADLTDKQDDLAAA